MTLLRRYRVEIILALVALLWHLLIFWAVVTANNNDIISAIRADDGYFEIAQNILLGNRYSMATSSPYVPNPLRTPGYIYFIVGTWVATGSAVGTALIQTLLACLIPILGMHIARSITKSSRAGIITGTILALDPTLALLSFQLYTETVFLVLFYAWILVMFRYIARPSMALLITGALLLGIATLVKASTQFIPFVVAIGIMWRFGRVEWRTGLMHGGIYIAIVGAILTPWIVRNSIVFGAPGLSTQTPYVLYTNFAPAVLTVARGSDFWHEVTTFSTRAERDGGVITFENSGPYVARAIEVIREHPFASFIVAGRSLVTFFTHDGVNTLVVRSGYSSNDFLPIVVLARLFWIALTVTASIGAFVYFLRQRSLLAVFCITLVAYFALTSIIAAFGTNPRYRLPVDPILIAFAVLGTSYVLERIRHFRRVRACPT